jgi:hypothetical protein
MSLEPQFLTNMWFGGWGGIRTHGTLARSPVFKTGSFNHSDTHPLTCGRGVPTLEITQMQVVARESFRLVPRPHFCGYLQKAGL